MIKNKANLTCRITLLVKTRDLSPPATFDGLLPIGITTQSINDFLMTGRSCLRDTLSQGISTFLASRVGCISAPTQYSETAKCSNPNHHTRNWDIYIYRFNRGSPYSDPWESLSLDLGYPARSRQCWPDINMYLNHIYRADQC